MKEITQQVALKTFGILYFFKHFLSALFGRQKGELLSYVVQ